MAKKKIQKWVVTVEVVEKGDYSMPVPWYDASIVERQIAEAVSNRSYSYLEIKRVTAQKVRV